MSPHNTFATKLKLALGTFALIIILSLDASAPANAVINQDHTSTEMIGGVVYNPEIDRLKEVYKPISQTDVRKYSSNATDAELPSYYSSREDFGDRLNITTKEQNTENTCWLYAAASTIDYALGKQNVLAPHISAKHMDYQFVSGNDAYTNVDAKNPYYDRWVETVGSFGRREIGGGGNQFTLRLALSNHLAVMNDYIFTSILKENDPRLSKIRRYEQLWYRDLVDTEDVLTPMSDGSYAYTVKQDYNKINDPEKIEYMVTGSEELYYPFYGENEDKTAVVDTIKRIVFTYGAAEVFTYYDLENCGAFDDGGLAEHGILDSDFNNIIIDRTTYDEETGQTSTLCDENTGHAMTIIGWNDNFTYKDGDIPKTGAFIVQNSWGDRFLSYGEEWHEVKYYMSYDSAFDIIYLTQVERTNDYDHIYSIDDYGAETITPDEDAYIYEFTSTGPELIEQIVFNQNLYAEHDYKIYVSTTGASDDFRRIDDFTAVMGQAPYKFDEPIRISGRFAIMIKDKEGDKVDKISRGLNILNVYTTNTSGESEEEIPIKSFTLHYDTNGGRVDADTVLSQTCTTTGSTCSVIVGSIEPQKNNANFLGWSETREGQTVDYVSDSVISLSGDKTIYAVYEDMSTYTYTLILDANGGTFSGETTATSTCTTVAGGASCSVTVPDTTPTLDNKTFKGWASSQTATVEEYSAGDIIELSADKTIYAVYQENDPIITDDGEITWIQEKEHEISSNVDIIFRINYPMELFSSIAIDGESLSSDLYTITSGSTIITIYASHINTLNIGEHEVSVAFSDGFTVHTNFTISQNAANETNAPDTPNTGFFVKTYGGVSVTNIAIIAGNLIMAALAAFGISRRFRVHKF